MQPACTKSVNIPKEEFKQAVEIDGQQTESWEIIYFKLYESQTPVTEKAIETPARVLGSDRSRGYCLEMICADLFAGADLGNGDQETLLFSMTRFFKFPQGPAPSLQLNYAGRLITDAPPRFCYYRSA